MREVSGTGSNATPEQVARDFSKAVGEQGGGLYDALGLDMTVPDSAIDEFIARMERGESFNETDIVGGDVESREESTYAPTKDQLDEVILKYGLNSSATPEQVAAAFIYDIDYNEAQKTGGNNTETLSAGFPVEAFEAWARKTARSN